MPIPLDTRKKPADVKIHVSTGAGVDITWTDGHASHYDFAYLRDHCPCALCDDERRKQVAISNAARTASAALPIYKPKATARTAKAMGHYALHIDFTDGHSTGIFSYDYLRTLCPCEACARDFRSQHE